MYQGPVLAVSQFQCHFFNLNRSFSPSIPHLSDVIRLNVGGRAFAASRSTLSCPADPDSVLAKMFAVDSVYNGTGSRVMRGCKTLKNEEVFIDRSPEAFEAVLEYLRTGKLFKLPGKFYFETVSEICTLDQAKQHQNKLLLISFTMNAM